MQGTAIVPDGFVKPGDIIAGKYKIVRILGEGGMGIVVEAVHQTLDQRVAIKFHRPQTVANAEATARFLREAKSAAQIKSEHVVRVSDVATLDTGVPYFVMEYLEGRDLDSIVQTDGPLPIPIALDYTLQVCEALAEAHAAGIVHRDLKPANLFLARRADGSPVIKLLDFGISKTLPKGSDAELSMTKTRALMGSPLYMAPEQMRSTRRVDHRADIWSLGVMMHEILTGETPFLGETLPEVCASIAADDPIPLTAKLPDAPAELEEVILRCLEKDSERRFSDVAELAMSLAPVTPPECARSIGRIVRILRGQATPAPGPVSLRPSAYPPRSSPSPRPSTPFASFIPSPNDPNNDTLCIEPSDQKRSGVAPKLRIRASSPDAITLAPGAAARAQAETLAASRSAAETLAATSPSVDPAKSGKGKIVAGLVSFAIVAAGLAFAFAPRRTTPVHTEAPPAVAVAPPPQPSPAPAPPSAEAPSEPPTPVIEFVDIPAAKAAADPQASALARHPGAPRPAAVPGKPGDPKVDPKLDPKAKPGAQASASASAQPPAPAPTGTAAFGAVRD